MIVGVADKDGDNFPARPLFISCYFIQCNAQSETHKLLHMYALKRKCANLRPKMVCYSYIGLIKDVYLTLV